MTSRTLAIGDIHGCDRALAALIDLIQPTAEDTLVVLGDVVDRGPGTRQAIEQLLELQQRCKLVFLIGNHEEMMIEAMRRGNIVRAWLQFGGLQAVESMRLHLAANKGVVPARLSDVTIVAVPDDPQTGKPFEYAVVPDGFTLSAPATEGQTPHAGNSFRYHVQVRKK